MTTKPRKGGAPRTKERKKPEAAEVPTPKGAVLWPIEDLIPYANNPRQHSDEQVAAIAASIQRFGFNDPIGVDKHKGIIEGHGRLMAAKLLGLTEVPVIELHHLTDAQRRAYIIAHNRLALDATWDDKLLAGELRAIAEQGIDPSLTGFGEDELEELLAREDGGGDGEGGDGSGLLEVLQVTIEDPRHTVTPGDVWALGPHRLLCVSVISDWPTWVTYLTDETSMFVPYPGPFVPVSPKAKDRKLVMVQPDPWIAGHLLDRYEEIMGEGTTRQVTA